MEGQRNRCISRCFLILLRKIAEIFIGIFAELAQHGVFLAFRQLWHGKNGFLVMPGDIDQLVDAIAKLCEDSEMRMKISTQAWTDITERFALDTHISKLKGYLEEV